MNPSIPGYRIQREVGKGGMGMVYRALRDEDGSAVALKILPPNLVNETSARRFQREGSALKAIQHPNIVRVFDVGARDGLHFIAMEFVEGRPLSSLLREHGGNMPIAMALDIMRQVAAALDVLHQKAMIHRDLKPGNIMVTPNGVVKLLDFGLVQMDGLTMLTATGNVVGTPGYMSPEQCTGTALDQRSDIYSFGLVLYELLTGQPPFQSESVYELLEMQKTMPPPSLRASRRNIPARLEQVVLQCLEKDPGQRPLFIREVQAALDGDDVARETTRDALTLSSPGPASSGHSRRRIYGVAAALLAIICVAAFFLFPEQARALRTRIGGFGQEHGNNATGGAPLEEVVEERYRALARADEIFSRGETAERRGALEAAFRDYLEAIALHREQPAYYRALIALAPRVARVDDAARAVRAYLDLPTSQDPDGRLRQWLQSCAGQ